MVTGFTDTSDFRYIRYGTSDKSDTSVIYLNCIAVTDKPVTVTDSVTAETTLVYGCDGCDGFFENSLHTEKITEAVEEKISCVNDLQNDPQPVTRHQPVTPLKINAG